MEWKNVKEATFNVMVAENFSELKKYLDLTG